MTNVGISPQADIRAGAEQAGEDAGRTKSVPTAGAEVGAEPRNPPEAPSSTLTEKLETLAGGVRDTAQDAGAAVEGVTTAVDDTVGKVTAAVSDTLGTVKRTFASLGHSFDVRRQVRRHPWLMLGAAALLGYVLGSLTRRPRRASG